MIISKPLGRVVASSVGWLRVASLGDLIAMKILARDNQTRPQDRLDLRALLSQANEHERQVAKLALAEVCALGYNRGRLLEVELAAAEVEFKQ